ncbi:hypothetical protein [Brevibacterium atlanticum]|uniref:hypothetical protein n=1 Tax=Brevibacterium atlanticum TaxID=2697563 RepID=UPI001422DBA1|nr:hypothetical protein [Brevibacterium atlanticum]
MTVERGLGRHLRWIVPLLLIPLSIVIFGMIALMALPSSDGPGLAWLVVVAGLCTAVAPIVFMILTITGAQKTYRMSALYGRKVQKRNEIQARRMEQQIVAEGGPRCDFEARTIARVQATHWCETLLRGEALSASENFNINLEPGESLVDQYRAKYARFYGQDVTYRTAGTIAMGSPLFVIGAMIGSSVGNANARAQAQRQAAAQWREIQYVDVLVTDRRLIIPVGGRMLSFYYNALAAFYPDLDAMTLTLDFGDNTEPLQLFSPNIAATSVLIVRQLKGADGLRNHPAIKSISDRAVTA